MKKRAFYLAAVFLAALALSCNKEQEVTTPLRDTEEEGVFYVSMMDLSLDANTGEPSTRTTLEKDGNSLKTKWLNTDKIGILVPANLKRTPYGGASVLSQGYVGFPLGQPTIYAEGRTAVFSGTVPAYMRVRSGSGQNSVVVETALREGVISAFYPTMASTSVSAVVSESGSTTETVSLLNLSESISIGTQSGTLAGLANYAIMTATGDLIINDLRQPPIGKLTSPLNFRQEVAVLHIDHMLLGLADEIDMSEGLTLTLSGSGIGNSVSFSSSTGQKTVAEGNIVITLTEDDIYEVEPEDWDDAKDRYALPEGCGKVIMHTDEADMDGGTYYLEDMYVAFIPKNFQSGAELSLTATGTGYGTDFQGDYLWNARTAYQAGKVYHLRDKKMQASKLLPSGSSLAYYDDGYKPLDGASFLADDEFWLYVQSGADVNQVFEFAYASTSNEKVAQVEDGKLICIGNGTAEITVKDKNGNTLSAQITVIKHYFSSNSYLTADIDPEDIIVQDNKPVALVFAGETLQLMIKKGDEILDPRHFTWSVGSNRTADVSVDENGLVTRHSNGEAEIYARDKNGESRTIIVAAQDSNASLVFCDEDGRKLQNYQLANGLALSKNYRGKWLAPILVKPAEGQGRYTTVSHLERRSYVNYLTVEKYSDEDNWVPVQFGTVYDHLDRPAYTDVFYSSGDEPALSTYKVTYNGPYGKVSLNYLFVLHDKITIEMDDLTFEQGCLSPAGGRVPIHIVASSSFAFPIEWEMISPSWSDYDPGEGPLITYDAPWTTESWMPFTLVAQIPMKKTGEVHNVTVLLQATTAGNRGGVTRYFSLFPTIKNSSIEAIPVKHDSVTENINLADYVEWSSSNQVLSLGTGCGFVSGATSTRTKVGAELKLVFHNRNNAWLNLATSPLYSHITVSTSCDAGYYFSAYNFYHSNVISEVIYGVQRPSSTVSGYLTITDGLGNTKTATVLVYPDKVP